jgi:hypothetical protein
LTVQRTASVQNLSTGAIAEGGERLTPALGHLGK